jgi:AcrR family transcriptional regulator
LKNSRKKGYFSVSIRDIADAVGITSGSLYNHISSKDEIFDKVLDQVGLLYRNYFDRLDEVNQKAASFKEVMDNMFVELLVVVDVFMYYALGLALTEQFHSDKAAELLHDVLIKYSTDCVKKQFDDCVAKGWIKPFNTRLVASMIMDSVLVNNNLRVQEDLGREIPYDISARFEEMRDFWYQYLS